MEKSWNSEISRRDSEPSQAPGHGMRRRLSFQQFSSPKSAVRRATLLTKWLKLRLGEVSVITHRGIRSLRNTLPTLVGSRAQGGSKKSESCLSDSRSGSIVK